MFQFSSKPIIPTSVSKDTAIIDVSVELSVVIQATDSEDVDSDCNLGDIFYIRGPHYISH